LVSLLGAQGTTRDTGAIRGIVVDDQASPLPGVNITVSSPSLMGTSSVITNVDGVYRITLLPVGTYTLVSELQGFQTVKREGLIVSLGMTLAVNITMLPAKLQEEIRVVGESPLVDVKASTGTQRLNRDSLQNLPVRRNLFSAIALMPGVVGDDNSATIKGGTSTNTILSMDGLYANDPDNALPVVAKVDYNVIQEVSVITGGMPAEIGTASGGFVNVVTKTGSNKFSALLQAYYDNKSFSSVVLPEEQLRALGLGKPAVALYTYDLAAGLGGPIVKDKLWFYANIRHTYSKTGSGFKPWVSPTGVSYGDYDIIRKTYEGFIKLSFQPSKAIRFSLSGNYRNDFANTGASGLYNPFDTTYHQDPYAWVQGTGVVTWVMNANSILELRGGYLARVLNLPMVNPKNTDVPYMHDSYTGYTFGSGWRPNEWLIRPSKQISLQWTRFQDNFLGASHEIKTGVEVVTGATKWASWKNNGMDWLWYNGNPYYYRGLYGLTGPHPLYGDGYVGWSIVGTTKDGSMMAANTLRIGAFLQDSVSIKNRLTVNFGIRFDRTTGHIPDVYHIASGGAAEAVGAAVFLPKYGFNPYAEFRQDGTGNLITWNVFDPRLGVTYDLFGDGKTAVKFNLGRYHDWLYALQLGSINPLFPDAFYFRWWDKNNNKYPDAPPIDYYEDTALRNPATMSRDYWTKLVLPGTKAPYDDQILVGIDREFFADFKIGLSYQYKKKSNMVDRALTDLVTGKTWYRPDSGYWVPFTTTVPAIDIFPAQQVTMYFKRKDAPSISYSLTNVPEAYRKYSCLEISFEKRMSHGWQLGGSINWSKLSGNAQGLYNDIVAEELGSAVAYIGDDANWFVNQEGRPKDDRPLVIKLFGTFKLPYGIISSFFYNYYNGQPWQRTVKITPPAAWAMANNVDPYTSYSVNLETPGVRRYYTYQNCDFRLEKIFSLGRIGQLGAYVDIFNLLGQSYVNVTENPGGTWLPMDNNTISGKYTPSGSYKRITSISNISRVLRLSIRYSF
jgi:hypothetical protein